MVSEPEVLITLLFYRQKRRSIAEMGLQS